MAAPKPNRKVGSAYRIQLATSNDAQKNLVICRSALSGMSAELDALLSGPLVLTLLPERPALVIYSERKWSELRPRIESMENSRPHVRRFQRLMLGNACHFSEFEEVVVPKTLEGSAHLRATGVLIAFDGDSAEFWAEGSLAEEH